MKGNAKRLLIECGLFSMLVIALQCTHQQKLRDFPNHIHAWTQSDRYALAIGFANNGGNLFYPETYNLRPNLDQPHIIEKGITAVDLPLPDYLAGIAMRITGSTSPAIARLTIFLFSILGLWFLFRLGLLVGIGLVNSLIVIVFVSASPVFHYYQLGFLPSVPCLALTAVGYYWYYRYKKSGKQTLKLTAVVVLTIAALIRTPFLIHLVAVFLSEALGWLKKPETFKRDIRIWLLAPLIYFPWFFWKFHLAGEFGSLFLSKPAPAESLSDLLDLLKASIRNWHFHLFTKWHYLFGLFIVFASFFTRSADQSRKWLRNTALISLAGGLCYSLLMSKQLVYHDYYFLDAGFLPVILCLIAFMPPKNETSVLSASSVISIAGFVLVPGMLADLKSTETDRLSEPWLNRVELTNVNFKDAGLLIEKLNIQKNSRLLVLDAYTTNAPLILMKRYGYTVLWTSREQLIRAMELPAEFVVIQDLFLLSDVVGNYPEIAGRLERIGGNGKITVFRKARKPQPSSHEALLGLTEQQIISQGSMHESGNKNWTSVLDTALRGQMEGQEYGQGWEEQSVENQLSGYLVNLNVSFEKIPGETQVVFKRWREDSLLTYCYFKLEEYIEDKPGNHVFTCYFPVSTPPLAGEKVQIFIYNPAKSAFVLEDLKIRHYSRSN